MAFTSARGMSLPSSTVSSRMTSCSMGHLLDALQVLGAHDEGLLLVAVHDVDDERFALLAGDDAGQALEALVRHAAVLAGFHLDGHVRAFLELAQDAVRGQDALLPGVLQQQVAGLGTESLGADGHGWPLFPRWPRVGYRRWVGPGHLSCLIAVWGACTVPRRQLACRVAHGILISE